jgi:hypothetical protein
MSTQTDVSSAHLSAAGSLFAGRARLKGFSIAPVASTAATFEFRDGGSGGTVLCQIDIASQTNPVPYYCQIPGEGILFKTSLHLTISVGSVTGITVFYG